MIRLVVRVWLLRGSRMLCNGRKVCFGKSPALISGLLTVVDAIDMRI